MGTVQHSSEIKRASTPEARLSDEERLLILRKEAQGLGSDAHPNLLLRFLIRLLEIRQPVAIDDVARILGNDFFSEESILGATHGHPSVTLTHDRELVLRKPETESSLSKEALLEEILAKTEDRAISYPRKIPSVLENLSELSEGNAIFTCAGRDDDRLVVFPNNMPSVQQASPELCQIWHSHTLSSSKADIYDKLNKLGIRPSTSFFQEQEPPKPKRAKAGAKRSGRVRLTNVHLNLF